MISERLKTFFGKVKKGLGERLSEVKPEDIAKFVAKEAVGAIPVVGPFLKDVIDEFSPNEKGELIKELKELSESQFKEISEEVGVSVEYLAGIQKFTLYTFKELRADHEEIKELLLHLIETGEPSTSIIQVGRDFNIGDASGQIAIGEGITQTQTVYKDCTFILPDGSTVHGKLWLYTEGIRPATDPANIFGRRQELEKIDEFLKDSSALAITGFSGTGKSTLASMYIDRIEKRGEFAGIYWRKVGETIDIGDVVGSFFMLIGKPIKDIGDYKNVEDLLDLLFRELTAAPYFLALDNFEILLDPKTNKPIKPGFSDLIERANKSDGRSRVLFTSWECPASEHGIRPAYYNIGGLDDSAAIQLLRQHGLTEPDDELKKAIELSGGHPLALILLVQLVKGEGETLSGILADDTLWIGEEGEVATNILDKVYKERLNEEEHKLLQYVSLYRVPVPLKAIVVSASDPDWTEAKVKKTALSLKRKSLLQRAGENYWEESLIHNYAYIKLVDGVERHKLACQYYLSLPLPEKRIKKEDVRSLIEAHYHACMAKEYDRAAGIIFDYKLDEDLDRWGNYNTLIDLYQRMLPKDPFRDKLLLSNKKINGMVIGSLGTAYYYLGELRKAMAYYEKALKIAQEIGDRQSESHWLGDLGNAFYVLGEKRKVTAYYEKALKIAQEIGNKRYEGYWLGDLGSTYSVLGEKRKAMVYYEKALKIAQEIGDRRREGLWQGNLGSTYRDLGEKRKAMAYYEKALKIAQEIGDRRHEGLWQGHLGSTYRDLGEVRKDIEYHEKALKIAQEIGDRPSEGGRLGSLGVAYYYLGEEKKAIEYYEKALDIAQEIGDRRREGLWQGNLGLAYSVLGEVGKAIEYYEKALEIAQEIGDRQHEGLWLNHLGAAFRDEKKYKEALAFYLLAKDIRTLIEDPNLETTESNLKNLEEELGGKEFEKLAEKVAPRVEEIVRKTLEGTNLQPQPTKEKQL